MLREVMNNKQYEQTCFLKILVDIQVSHFKMIKGVINNLKIGLA